MSKPEILCDVDGVVLNFNKGARHALRLAGYQVPEVEPNDWDWYQPLGVDDDAFWDATHKLGPAFYESVVEEFPWADDLLNMLASIGNLSFLTRMSKDPVSNVGKLTRLQKSYPRIPVITMSHDQKHLVAGPCRVLIDDKNENIDGFRNAGGIGIFMPQLWNRAKMALPYRFGYLLRELRSHNLLTCKED